MAAPVPDPLAQVRAQDVHAALRDPHRKQAFVTPMFDVIAPRYDAFTRRFSFGMDATWKRTLVDAAVAAVPHAQHILDAACGTGDLAVALAARLPAALVRGVDPSTRMLAEASRQHAHLAPRVQFVDGRLEALPAEDGAVDLLTAGYGFRNAAALDAALAESARVLAPGGLLATLDFYRPAQPVWRRLFLRYLRTAGDVVGWWWHRTPVVYGYIADSIDTFVSADEFSQRLHAVGLHPLRVQRFLGGGIAIHLARKATPTVPAAGASPDAG